MLGMSAKGLAVTYAIGGVMLILTILLGIWWNRHLPSSVKEEGWTTRIVARIAILAAVAAAGGMITIPGPATSIRLDSLAGYFGTLMFGWQVGSVIAMFGTFFSNLMSGFSGWAALVPYYMINMAFAVTAFGIATKKGGKILGLIVGTFINTLCILPWIVMLGWSMMVPTLLPQILASFVNCLLATIAYSAISAARGRRKVEAPLPDEADESAVSDTLSEAAGAAATLSADAESDSVPARAPGAKPPIIHIKDLSFHYAETKREVLKNISLDINEGEFVVITGPTGAGKTTLCETLNGIIPNFVKGTLKGTITVDGMDPRKEKVAHMAQTVGVVFQDPNTQLFGMTVEEDIAFGATNLGYTYDECMERVGRSVKDLNLSELLSRKPMELSGGQKQSVAIAGIYAMLPKIIVCDEPTSMLDPIGKKNVFSLIKNINKEYGITVILVEHVMSEVARYADKVIVMDKGRIALQGSVGEGFSQIDKLNELGLDVPQTIDLSLRLKESGLIDRVYMVPEELTETLKGFAPEEAAGAGDTAAASPDNAAPASPDDTGTPPDTASAQTEAAESAPAVAPASDEPAVQVDHLTFSYLGDGNQVDDVSLTIKKGEFAAIIGQNGSGKTTLCRNIIGLLKPQGGSIKVVGIDVATKSVAELASHIGYCFQNPDEQIFKDSVEDELLFGPDNLGLDRTASKERIDQILADVGLTDYRTTWPKYLSKGERQRLTMGSIIAMDPDIVIVDEPTTGQDWRETLWIMDLLKKINDLGKTIIIITHNIEIVCRYCTRVLAMCRGKILLDGTPAEVLSQPELLAKTYVSPSDITRIAQALPYMPDDILSVDDFCAAFERATGREVTSC